MITLDASVVIALLNPRDLHHLEAVGYLRSRAAERLQMHPLNLAEVLVGGVRSGQGERMLADLTGLGVEEAPKREGEPLRLARLRVESGLKLPDCCALDAAIVSGSVLATVDVRLADAARSRGVEVGP